MTVSKATDLNNQPMQATGQFSFPEAPCLCCAAPAVWLSQHQWLVPGQRQTVNPLGQSLRRNWGSAPLPFGTPPCNLMSLTWGKPKYQDGELQTRCGSLMGQAILQLGAAICRTVKSTVSTVLFLTYTFVEIYKVPNENKHTDIMGKLIYGKWRNVFKLM